MKETLKVINQMVKDGVVEKYAIGGAVVAIYYLEPFETADLDAIPECSLKATLFSERMER